MKRLGQGAFQIALRALYKELFGTELVFQTMGKPTKVTYDYVREVLNVDVAYGVGDNELSDIAGANAAEGFKSVLVKTGCVFCLFVLNVQGRKQGCICRALTS